MLWSSKRRSARPWTIPCLVQLEDRLCPSGSGLSLVSSTPFNIGTDTLEGNSIALANGNIEIAGTDTTTNQGLLLQYAVPPGNAPTNSAILSSKTGLNGVAATASEVVAVGYATPPAYGAVDNVGDVENKTFVSEWSPASLTMTGHQSGPVQSSGSTAFFPYSGYEGFNADTAASESGTPYFYAAGNAQANGENATAIVAKYDASGNLQWWQALGNTGFFDESFGSGIATLNGNVYVAGVTDYPYTNNPAAIHAALWGVNSAGSILFADQDTTTPAANFLGLTAFGGNLYAVGDSNPSSGTQDYLIEKFDPSGNLLWETNPAAAGTNVLTGVTAVGNEIYAVGYTNSGGGANQAVILQIDPNTGAILSQTLYGNGTLAVQANGITTDGTALYVVGQQATAQGGQDVILLDYLVQNVVTAGLSGPTDGVTEQHRPFVLTANDSNSGNNSAGFSFAINWGDGTSQTTIGQSGVSTDHQYATTGTYTISVTATNLTDSITSAAFTQNEIIAQTEIQNGNLALGGVAGNNAWVITKGSTGSGFTATVNGISPSVIKNYKPAAGMQVFLYSGNGTNTVSFNDSTISSTDTFTIGSGFVTYNGATFVPQNPVSGWAINGSNANDTYTINGTLTATINAGSKNDTFNMASGANLLGTINGGGGVNTLSYTSYTTSGVIVDLPLGSATGINGGASGGIASIQNVTGSGHGGDILVGDSHANVLKSLKGHNILIGGSGGGDTLTSGGSGDILIAGSTNYDSNIAALQFILNEWLVVTPSTYNTVINNIQTSSTDPLNASTVTDSGSPDLADTLNGKTGKTTVKDWYFAHTTGGTNPNDTINNEHSGETVTSI